MRKIVQQIYDKTSAAQFSVAAVDQLRLNPIDDLRVCDKFISGVGFSCLDCSPRYNPACCTCFEHSEHRAHTWVALGNSQLLCRNVELDNLFADLSQT